jgi:YegS/Rv2252/BmrU family lipid kinase
MAVPTLFIVNPAAAGGRAGRWWRDLEAEARRVCGPADVVFSSAPGDATRLAREVAGQSRFVVAVGGDGTVNEVVNGLIEDDRAVSGGQVLGIVGIGTGRDLARSLGLPREPRAQVSRLAGPGERRLDVGKVRYAEGREARVRYYANVASFGLSGVTDRKMNGSRLRWLPARIAFQVAVMEAVIEYRNAPVRLRLDDGPWQDATVKVAAVCNGRHFGGGMCIAPDAVLDDGLLDCIVIGDISVATLVRRFGTVYRGEHLRLPDVSAWRGRVLVAEPVDPSADVPLDIDGEALGRLPATFEILPGALRVRC